MLLFHAALPHFVARSQLKSIDDEAARPRTEALVSALAFSPDGRTSTPLATVAPPRQFDRLVRFLARLYRGHPDLASRFWDAVRRPVRPAKPRNHAAGRAQLTKRVPWHAGTLAHERRRACRAF